MKIQAGILTATVLALSACGGGGGMGGGPSVSGNSGGGGSALSDVERAITTTNAIGSPLKAFANYDLGANPAASTAMVSRAAVANATGTCTNGIKFFAPDVNGDPNSTESRYFYDVNCTQMARDVVRTWTQQSGGTKTPGTEIVQSSEKQYALVPANVSPPLRAERDDVVTISNALFDPNGFPQRASGYVRTSTGFLNIGNTKTIIADYELIMQPSNTTTNSFCSDQAGYNAIGIGTPGETFGWAGGVTSGTRTVNADGSVTWNTTHAGQSYLGPVGSMAIGVGTPNTTCPIATPLYTITGGKVAGSHNIPVVATFSHGLLTALSITNAQLAGGLTLNVTTTPATAPQDDLFINGVVSNGSTAIAVFNVNAFGDGTLTIVSTGDAYAVTDWRVNQAQSPKP